MVTDADIIRKISLQGLDEDDAEEVAEFTREFEIVIDAIINAESDDAFRDDTGLSGYINVAHNAAVKSKELFRHKVFNQERLSMVRNVVLKENIETAKESVAYVEMQLADLLGTVRGVKNFLEEMAKEINS